jgi:hypothetical protein
MPRVSSVQVPAAALGLGLPEGRRFSSSSRWLQEGWVVPVRLGDDDGDGVDAHETGDDIRRWELQDGDLPVVVPAGCLCSSPAAVNVRRIAPPSGCKRLGMTVMKTHLRRGDKNKHRISDLQKE